MLWVKRELFFRNILVWLVLILNKFSRPDKMKIIRCAKDVSLCVGRLGLSLSILSKLSKNPWSLGTYWICLLIALKFIFWSQYFALKSLLRRSRVYLQFLKKMILNHERIIRKKSFNRNQYYLKIPLQTVWVFIEFGYSFTTVLLIFQTVSVLNHIETVETDLFRPIMYISAYDL